MSAKWITQTSTPLSTLFLPCYIHGAPLAFVTSTVMVLSRLASDGVDIGGSAKHRRLCLPQLHWWSFQQTCQLAWASVLERWVKLYT